MKTSAKALMAGLVLIVLFCGSFYFFYRRAQSKSASKPRFLTSDVIGRPLPKTHLINVVGETFEDERLRLGRIVLVFMMPDCNPCDQENEFLKTAAHIRQDVRFVYVIPFGNKGEALKAAQNKYALEPFYDEGSTLSRELEIYQVPVKVFLEDGVIKRTWVGSTDTDQEKVEFKDWLNRL